MPPPRGRGASPFGDPFTFGKPLVLNSQPPTFFGSSLAPPPDASASDAPMGGGAVTRSRSARRKVGGYGVTAPAKHGPKDTFTRTTGTDAPSPIPGDDRDRPARRVAPRVVTKIPVLDDWEPAEEENEDPSVIPPHVDDVPASAAATRSIWLASREAFSRQPKDGKLLEKKKSKVFFTTGGSPARVRT